MSEGGRFLLQFGRLGSEEAAGRKAVIEWLVTRQVSHGACRSFLLQHNCDPRFFTTVVFYTGSVSMATQLKFQVFDVYDREESKVSFLMSCSLVLKHLIDWFQYLVAIAMEYSYS